MSISIYMLYQKLQYFIIVFIHTEIHTLTHTHPLLLEDLATIYMCLYIINNLKGSCSIQST